MEPTSTESTCERVRAIQERRRSNAAGKHHDRRTKRLRTRRERKRAAIDEQGVR
jgi:hypothetical protein